MPKIERDVDQPASEPQNVSNHECYEDWTWASNESSPVSLASSLLSNSDHVLNLRNECCAEQIDGVRRHEVPLDPWVKVFVKEQEEPQYERCQDRQKVAIIFSQFGINVWGFSHCDP
jgi:hypothetical protein